MKLYSRELLGVGTLMSEVRTIMREDRVVSAGWGLVLVALYLIVDRSCRLQ